MKIRVDITHVIVDEHAWAGEYGTMTPSQIAADVREYVDNLLREAPVTIVAVKR